MNEVIKYNCVVFLFPDKLAFVGFKGSFRPDWVRMSVDEERAKLHQVLPIPVIKMMKLWRRATHAAGHLRLAVAALPDDPSYSRTAGLLNLKHQSQPSMCLCYPETPPSSMWQRGRCDSWIVSSVDYTWVSTGKNELKTIAAFLVFVSLGDVCLHVFSMYVEKEVSDCKCCEVSSF